MAQLRGLYTEAAVGTSVPHLGDHPVVHTDGRGVVLHQGKKTMQTEACVLWHSGLKCDVVFDQEGLSRGGLMYW